MKKYDTDIAIVGGGPVGVVLACALAQTLPKTIKIKIFQGKVKHFDPQQDKRVIALNQGSRTFLEKYNLWDESRHCAIKTVHVSQQNRLGRTLISHELLSAPALGYVVSYASLHNHLQDKLNELVRQEKLSIHEGSSVSEVLNMQDGVNVKLNEGEFSARLAIMTLGTQDTEIHRDYQQTAIVTTVRPRFVKPGWAWERFTPQGPLAVLPHPLYKDALSVVWCVHSSDAPRIMSLDTESFALELNQTFANRLGKLSVLEKPVSFELHLHAHKTPIDGNKIFMGNAAQTLHPVAGQGLNLGFRDVAEFTRLAKEKILSESFDKNDLIHAYQDRRTIDRSLTRHLTDVMPRLFSTGLAPVEHALGLSLLGMSLFPVTSQALALHFLQGFRK